jgi:T-complex protein 1 subunit eta
VITRQLSDNAGFDATDILNKLRQKHALPNGEGKLYGVDVNKGDIVDTFDAFVWEPSLVKVNAITAATEAACLVLLRCESARLGRSIATRGRTW